MKIPGFKIIFLLSMLGFGACSQKTDTSMNSIIPQPVTMESMRGFFQFSDKTNILYPEENKLLQVFTQNFLSDIENFYGIKGISETNKPLKNNLVIELEPEADIPYEGYKLKIQPGKIQLTASSEQGIFYGLQSLSQLIHLNAKEQNGKILLPAMEINDNPRFDWRGMHLDVGRHFMPVNDVKKYLDYMALYKFNKFHWHLTEDQGWRIEIKKYPLLTEIGAWRDETMVGHYNDQPRRYDGKKHGGFYTQEEIREIVKYASDRCIEVIPEIEMPGHARAAIASYPWLGVTGEKIGVKTEWGICSYIYMPSEETFAFLEDVLTEVMELFPSGYVHIGGDEAIKGQWEASKKVQKLIAELGLNDEHELQSYFVQRIEKFLNDNGKKLIGWDEILEGGLAPNATVMSWRGEEGGIAAAKMRHDVIMSPTSYCYFDYYQVQPVENEPIAIGGYLPIEKVYSYDPIPEALSADEAVHILGAQANVWTEYIPDFRQVEYMIFPRMLAMSEVTWTPLELKNEDDFMKRVTDHEKLFLRLGVNYSVTGMPKREISPEN